MGDGKMHPPTFHGIPLKWISLCSLTLQTTLQVFVIKWTQAENNHNQLFLGTTVVLFTEMVKTIVSFFLLAQESGGFRQAGAVMHGYVMHSPRETVKVCVPSLLYTIQNNLMLFSLSKLSAAVQQVTYQLKILTTALLTVLILGKPFLFAVVHTFRSSAWCDFSSM